MLRFVLTGVQATVEFPSYLACGTFCSEKLIHKEVLDNKK